MSDAGEFNDGKGKDRECPGDEDSTAFHWLLTGSSSQGNASAMLDLRAEKSRQKKQQSLE